MQPESSAVTELRDIARLMQRDARAIVFSNYPGTDESRRGIQICALSVNLLDAIGDTARAWRHEEAEVNADAVRRISIECRALRFDRYADMINSVMKGWKEQ